MEKFFGLNIMFFEVLIYSQYLSNCYRISLVVVDDEKLIKTISKLGLDVSVDIRVMVLPLPGGPHMIKALLFFSQLQRMN